MQILLLYHLHQAESSHTAIHGPLRALRRARPSSHSHICLSGAFLPAQTATELAWLPSSPRALTLLPVLPQVLHACRAAVCDPAHLPLPGCTGSGPGPVLLPLWQGICCVHVSMQGDVNWATQAAPRRAEPQSHTLHKAPRP